MACKGICGYSEYRVSKNSSGGNNATTTSLLGEPSICKKQGKGPYSVEGVMLCIICEVYFQTGGMFNRCPCCHTMMRGAPRPSGRSGKGLQIKKDRAREIRNAKAEHRQRMRGVMTTTATMISSSSPSMTRNRRTLPLYTV